MFDVLVALHHPAVHLSVAEMITHLEFSRYRGPSFQNRRMSAGALADEVNDLDLGGVSITLAGIKGDAEGNSPPTSSFLMSYLNVAVTERAPKVLSKSLTDTMTDAIATPLGIGHGEVEFAPADAYSHQ
jgi:hypothetical protein